MNESHPTPGPDLYAPRLIRVVSGIQTCPCCGKPVLDNILQAGWGFQSCNKAWRENRIYHRKCATEWWSLALPPDAFAGYLAAIMGADAARDLLVKAWPKSASLEPPQLWGFPLNSTDDTAWVQVAVRPRERHLHRRTRITQLVTALLL